MEKIITGEPLTVAGFTIIPVLAVSTGCRKKGKAVYCFGSKRPEYILAFSGTEKHAFKITGEQVPVDELINRFPELGNLEQS